MNLARVIALILAVALQTTIAHQTTIARQMLLSGGQLASYDQMKQLSKRWVVASSNDNEGERESTYLHIGCAFGSGLVGQTVCMPADVIKTKVLSGSYSGVGNCIMDTFANEGFLGFYRGYIPAVMRQCPVIVVQMPIIEFIRTFMGLGNI